MSFLRNLWADLVDKRLWPIAVLLVAALAAVPVLLGGSSGADEGVAAIPATPGRSVTATDVRVSEETAPSTVAPVGTRHNPFRQPKAKTADTTPEQAPAAQTPSTPAPGGGTGGGAGGAAPGGSTPPAMTPATPAPSTGAPKPENTKVLRVNLRFGEPGKTKQKAFDDIARLSALPSADEPIVIYLGVKKDRRTAVFLISSDATATGDGACKPSRTNCQTIEMREGDSTFLDIDLGQGPRQFQLDVRSIAQIDTRDVRKASLARARMSVAGQEFLRSSIESGEVSLSGLDYSDKTGTLMSTPRARTAGPIARSAYRIDVKVGAITRTDVRRLQILPQRSTARLLFLGVRDGGRSAAFLNLEDLPVRGAVCATSPTDCQRFTLHTGRTAFVGGVPVRIARLTLRRLASSAAAETVHTREDAVGRKLVGDHDLDLGDLALDPATGTLTRSPL
jgi:hypothetical protein